jgi:hypothetical protein
MDWSRAVLFLVFLFAWYKFFKLFDNQTTGTSSTALDAAPGVPEGIPTSILAHQIPVQIRFLRILPQNDSSLLRCAKSLPDIQESLKIAAKVWEEQAGIVLEFIVRFSLISLVDIIDVCM